MTVSEGERPWISSRTFEVKTRGGPDASIGSASTGLRRGARRPALAHDLKDHRSPSGGRISTPRPAGTPCWHGATEVRQIDETSILAWRI